MKKLKIFQVDAFTDELFKGNPAAVCVLDEWLDEDLMQKIGAENNLSETAFIVTKENDFEIRWFSPEVEVDLCGHATLASAFVVFNELGYREDVLVFHSRYKGMLKVTRDQDRFVLDFPSEQVTRIDVDPRIERAIGFQPKAVFKGTTKLMAELESEDEVASLDLDFTEIARLDHGLIVTAPGDKVDFVSRFFVPQFGINEDPVTGSAHTLLIPFWSDKLNKSKMKAKQISLRGGVLYCEDKGERVKIGGNAKLYLRGEILI